MGNLFSRPKAPPPAQVVYEPAPPPPVVPPAPVYVPPVTPAPVPNQPAPPPVAMPAEPDKPDPEAQASETRVQNLLRRRRGRAGTVETSWRGVLEQSPAAPSRKNLLGG
jgi:hypothetical protein